MEKATFFKSKSFKVLFPIVIVALAIALFEKGFAFGRWLYGMVN
jgi:hypothetical protein